MYKFLLLSALVLSTFALRSRHSLDSLQNILSSSNKKQTSNFFNQLVQNEEVDYAQAAQELIQSLSHIREEIDRIISSVSEKSGNSGDFWDSFTRDQQSYALDRLLEIRSFGYQQLTEEVFSRYDSEGNGQLDIQEFEHAATEFFIYLGLQISSSDAYRAFAYADFSKDGSLSKEEFGRAISEFCEYSIHDLQHKVGEHHHHQQEESLWGRLDQNTQRYALEKLYEIRAYGYDGVTELAFEHFDHEGNGYLDHSEFVYAGRFLFNYIGVPVSDEEISYGFAYANFEADGGISRKEFRKAIEWLIEASISDLEARIGGTGSNNNHASQTGNSESIWAHHSGEELNHYRAQLRNVQKNFDQAVGLLFEHFDTNRDQSFNHNEFVQAGEAFFAYLGLEVDSRFVSNAFGEFDLNHDGAISQEEFKSVLSGLVDQWISEIDGILSSSKPVSGDFLIKKTEVNEKESEIKLESNAAVQA